MDPATSRDDEALLVSSDAEEASPEPAKKGSFHARDVHVLSFAFLFIFSAYSAAQNLQSTVNTEGNLGTTSMGILYLSFTLFSLVASLTGTYLTSAARSHAKDCHLHEGTVIGRRKFDITISAEEWKALGVSGVGGAMAIFGASDAICSLAAGRWTSGLSSITLILSGGALLQILVLVWLLLRYSLSSGVLGPAYPLLVAVIWGIGDGVFNTQLNALLGILFKNDTEAAFAQLKVWQSAAISVVFFLSPHISFQAMLVVMVAALCVSVSGFLYLTLSVKNAFSSSS
ncbi:UNC93-like protein 3 [Acorus gramineus]|uniref:UNC93-like protein 3 n=1 Tax=Acorus gramineus TaxID=55184 RepID=A0AAV9AL58_ACOGR|nr:UNC93-like protein 3 [Acorus gramineus]